MRLPLGLISLLLLVQLDGFTQWPLEQSLVRRTITEGLSDNYIPCMAEDDNGFVWLATANGLQRFNGHKPRHLTNHQENVASERIFSIRKIPGNRLLIGSSGGISILHTSTGITHKIRIAAEPELSVAANEVEKVFMTPDNKILAATKTGVYVLDTTGKTIAILAAGFQPTDVAQKRIYFVLNMDMFSNGDAVIATTQGYYYFINQQNSFENIASSSQKKLARFKNFLTNRSSSYIFNINNKDQLFFIDFKSATADTLFVFDFKKNNEYYLPLGFKPNLNIRWDALINFHNDTIITITANRNGVFHGIVDTVKMQWKVPLQRSLTNDNIRYVLHTSNQHWLYGTENGLLISSFWKNNIAVYDLQRYLTTNRPQAVAAVFKSDTYQWIGFNSNEQGLIVLDSLGKLVNTLTLTSLLNDYDKNKFRFIENWSSDTIVVGSAVGLFLIHKRNFKSIFFGESRKLAAFPPVRVTAIFRDQTKSWWISMAGDGVWNYNPQTGQTVHYKPGKEEENLPLPFVHAFAEDSKGNIWMVHQRDGMVRWNSTSKKFDHIVRSWPKWDSRNFDCTGIIAQGDSSIWCYINGRGLFSYRPFRNELHAVAAMHDRGEDEFKTLETDKLGNLWMNLRHGVAIYNPVKKQLYRLGREQGLPDQFNTGHGIYCDSVQGLMWVGFPSKLAAISLEQKQPAHKVYTPVIAEVVLLSNKQLIDHSIPFQLNPDQNMIAIETDRISYDTDNPVALEYRLLLDEKPSEWIDLGNQQTIYLSNLAAGDYRFQVRPALLTGETEQLTTSISFRVKPKFNQTNLFKLFVISLAALAAYLAYRIRLRQLLKLQMLRHTISSDLHDDIGSRLTQLRFLNLIAKQKMELPAEAKRILTKMEAEIIKSGEALDEIVWNMKATNVNTEVVAARMRRYAANFFEDDDIQVTVSIDDNLSKLTIPAEQRKDLFLIYRELLNNVRKHANASAISINLTLQGNSMQLIVSDNGKGFDAQKQTERQGLKVLRQRLNKWSGSCTISTNHHQGTTVSIVIPSRKIPPLWLFFQRSKQAIFDK